MDLTGKMVYRAFVASFPYLTGDWDALIPLSQKCYEQVARELNRMNDDIITITALRCPSCQEMLEAEHAQGHACWLKESVR